MTSIKRGPVGRRPPISNIAVRIRQKYPPMPQFPSMRQWDLPTPSMHDDGSVPPPELAMLSRVEPIKMVEYNEMILDESSKFTIDDLMRMLAETSSDEA